MGIKLSHISRLSSCIISDVETWRMSGLRLLQHLKSSDRDVPIVLITGNPDGLSEAYCLKHGAIGSFRKAIGVDALVELIRFVLSEPDPEFS
jgi:DNA-binding NtrC family response regulator